MQRGTTMKRSMNVIHHIHRLKEKILIISTDTKKAFDKIQQLVMVKKKKKKPPLSTLEKEKGTYQPTKKPSGIIINDESLDSLSRHIQILQTLQDTSPQEFKCLSNQPAARVDGVEEH